MTNTTHNLFQGIIVPLVTPLTRTSAQDFPHLHGLIDHVIAGHVHGIFILGTTGESSGFDVSVRRQIIEETCYYAAGKTKLHIGIMHTRLSDAITLAKIAADNGADSIVLAEPYLPITQDAVWEYTHAFAAQCPLPVCLYTRPNQEIVFEIETLKKLLPLQKIEAIKDSSGNKDYFNQLLQLKNIRPDFSVLMGREELLAEAVGINADGGVTGGANLFPRLYVDLFNAAVRNDTDEISRLQKIVEAVVENVYCPDYLPGLKYALSCRNLCNEFLADPLRFTQPQQKKRIEDFLMTFDKNYL